MIIDRLKRAIAEQNWFAVGLELLIVVMGVVIGFQVTLWGQARADRNKAESYLIQLVSDLRETDALILETNAETAHYERAAGMLVRAFDESTPPPRDSVYTWLGQAIIVAGPIPILNTAEALVSTGDLNLIPNDELRLSISSYLQNSRVHIEFQRQITAEVLNRLGAIMEVIDIRQGMSRMPPSEFRAVWEGVVHPDLLNVTMPLSSAGVGANVPDDISQVFSSRRAYSLLSELAYRQGNLAFIRAQMLTDANELLQLLEVE